MTSRRPAGRGPAGPGDEHTTMDQDHDDTGANRPGTGGGAGVAPDDGALPRATRRPATSLLTWGIVALVLVIVIVLVAIKVAGTSATTTSSSSPPPPAPPAVVQAVTKIPASVYNAVGVTSPDTAITPPTVVSGAAPLQTHGRPEVLYVGEEFCPYCAAERWALVAALSRFGTFTGLEASTSGSNEAFPGTPTFSFAGTKYSSRYLAATLVEHYGDQKNPQGTGYAVLTPLTRAERGLMRRYDRTPTGTMLPFLDIANRGVLDGGAFSPSILQQLNSTKIAAGLTDPRDPATQAIVAAANEFSALICSADEEVPSSVCSSAGVTAASSALALAP